MIIIATITIIMIIIVDIITSIITIIMIIIIIIIMITIITIMIIIKQPRDTTGACTGARRRGPCRALRRERVPAIASDASKTKHIT